MLSLSGFIVDKIREHSDPFSYGLLRATCTDEDDKQFDTEIKKCHKLCCGTKHTASGLLATLTCGLVEPLMSLEDHSQIVFRDYLMELNSSGFRVAEHRKYTYEHARFSLAAAMRRYSCNGRFFVTEEGTMGMATPNTKAGDVVCILFGGRLPFVLRQESNHWTVVGNAYVHGFMDVSEAQSRVPNPADVHIRAHMCKILKLKDVLRRKL